MWFIILSKFNSPFFEIVLLLKRFNAVNENPNISISNCYVPGRDDVIHVAFFPTLATNAFIELTMEILLEDASIEV